MSSPNILYLEMLAHIPTPSLSGGFGVEENHQVYHNYCQLRNLAKDLLSKPQDKEATEKLSELVKRLNTTIN